MVWRRDHEARGIPYRDARAASPKSTAPLCVGELPVTWAAGTAQELQTARQIQVVLLHIVPRCQVLWHGHCVQLSAKSFGPIVGTYGFKH